MNVQLKGEWRAMLAGLAWLLAAVLISQVAHQLLYALLRRLSVRRHSVVAEAIIIHTRQASRGLFLLLADTLSRRGWPASRIDKLIGGNFARLFAEVWGA